MPFSVENFKANLPLGGVRPTLFEVTITNPINSTNDSTMQFRVQAASLPASQLGNTPIPYFGRTINVPGDRTFAPWNVTVLEDEDFKVKQTMEEWSNAINTMQGNIRTGSGALSAIKSIALVTQYSKTGEIIRVYRLNGVYPENVGEVNLGWADYNQLETYQITFQYDWWEIAGGTTGTLSV